MVSLSLGAFDLREWSLPSRRSQEKPKKKYVYTEDQKLELRQAHYRLLHEIDQYKRTSTFPPGVKTKSDRQGFKRKAKHYSIIAGKLHKNADSSFSRPRRVLWENEFEPILKDLHEKGAHYHKGSGLSFELLSLNGLFSSVG